jgi:hypothetical protein
MLAHRAGFAFLEKANDRTRTTTRARREHAPAAQGGLRRSARPCRRTWCRALLAHLGLENGHAARDIRELRDLLEAWRDARRTAWQTTIKVATTGILAALLVGAAIKLKLMGGPQ